MVCAGALYIVVQGIVPGTNSTHSGIPFVSPIGHLWFVQAIFAIFLVTATLDLMGATTSKLGSTAIFGASCALYLLGSPTTAFALNGAVYLWPFFLTGLAVGRHGDWLRLVSSPHARLVLVVVAAAWMATAEITSNRNTAAYLVIGVCLCLLAAGWRRLNSKSLSAIAPYSFGIYLFHVFFTAGTRIALYRMDITQIEIHVLLGSVMGVAGPIVLQRVLRPHPVGSFLFFGKPLPNDRLPTARTEGATLRYH